jgi:hypothetical protein
MVDRFQVQRLLNVDFCTLIPNFRVDRHPLVETWRTNQSACNTIFKERLEYASRELWTWNLSTYSDSFFDGPIYLIIIFHHRCDVAVIKKMLD